MFSQIIQTRVTDMSSSKNISTSELYKKLTDYIGKKFTEQKSEIEELVLPIERKCNQLEERIKYLERKIRKNNIVIFGLKTENTTSLLDQVLAKLNSILHINIDQSHINDIYKVGKKNVIVLEFLSNLTKGEIFKNIKNLKGTGISIANDLCKEDQQERQILYHNLRSAKNNNLPAYVKQGKLYVNGEQYTVEQLKKNSLQFPEEVEVILSPRSLSAPPTPNIREHREHLLSTSQEEEGNEISETSVLLSQADAHSETQKSGKEPSVSINRPIKMKEGRTNSESDTRSLRSKPRK